LNWIYSKVPELAKINQQQDANAISNSLQTETQVIHFFDFKMQQNTKLLTTNKATSVVLVNQGVDRPCKDSFDPYAKFYRLTLPKTTDGQSASNSFRVSVNIVENLSASGVGNGALKVQATRDNSENGRRLVDVQFCRTGGGISFVRQFSLAAIENIVQQTNAPQPAVNVDTRRELAQEGQVLKAAANTLIAYGKKGFSRWFFKRMPASGELLISNSTFGDPLPGVRKAAYLVNE
jgi:hypothetical protein